MKLGLRRRSGASLSIIDAVKEKKKKERARPLIKMRVFERLLAPAIR